MKTSIYFALALGMLVSTSQNAGAAMDGMHASMAMPKCASGDPVVGMNTMNKMYMTHEQMKMKSAGMSDSQTHAMMMKNHVKMMCKSAAKSMGGKMMGSKR